MASEFEGAGPAGSVYQVESCNTVFLGGISYSLFRNNCCRMYHLATMHTVLHTDGQSTL